MDIPLSEDREGKKKLAGLLLECFDGLKLYGKEPEQLENTIRLFCRILADCPFEQIDAAFTLFLKSSNEMPTPADIYAIITRGGKPAFNQSVYIRLEKKGHDSRSREEDEYMREYEEYQMNGEISS